MDWSRKWKLVWRWSLLSAIPIALYWGMQYLAQGSVPSQTLRFYVLGILNADPHVISRWWDVAIGPLSAIATILIVTSRKMTGYVPSALVTGALVGAVFAVTSTLQLGLSYHPDTPEQAVFVLALIAFPVGAIVALFLGGTTLWGVLGYALASGLLFGLAYGILLGVVDVVLIWGLGGAGAVLGTGVKKLFEVLTSKATWQSLGSWLAGK